MFSDDDIAEVMAEEIGGFQDARQTGFTVDRNDEVKPKTPHMFHRHSTVATSRQFWPHEQEPNPSVRHRVTH